jgi:hypothetical protein
MSILDSYDMRHDLDVELDRDKTMATDQWWTAPEYLEEQMTVAVAAEGAQKAYAYVEYLKLAAMAIKRAYRLCDARRVPGKGDSPL